MFSERVGKVMKREPMRTAGPELVVSEAVRLMTGSRVGAVVVVVDGAVVGIFTERDAVQRVLARDLDPRTTPLGAVMTPDPMTVGPERSFGYALLMMHEHGFRHVPVVDNGKAVGIVTSRDVMDPEMEEFISETRRREGLR
jgi:CBS domain-containing protein